MAYDMLGYRYAHRNSLNGETNRTDEQQAEMIQRHKMMNAYYSAYQSQIYEKATQPEVIDGGKLVADPVQEPTEAKALPKPE